MVLPLLTSLEVRLTPRSLYLRNEKLERMIRDDGRIPVPYNVSIRNAGDGAVRIIGGLNALPDAGPGVAASVRVVYNQSLRTVNTMIPLPTRSRLIRFSGITRRSRFIARP